MRQQVLDVKVRERRPRKTTVAYKSKTPTTLAILADRSAFHHVEYGGPTGSRGVETFDIKARALCWRIANRPDILFPNPGVEMLLGSFGLYQTPGLLQNYIRSLLHDRVHAVLDVRRRRNQNDTSVDTSEPIDALDAQLVDYFAPGRGSGGVIFCSA
ncbi:hypothetical protein VTN00DRAFT_3201 [Thermoascus crustaceus]|uniref:uncharacterized protein n=1 Tax=Thermoascus crustaceus TaxID=5088 RepID=UPI003743B10C